MKCLNPTCKAEATHKVQYVNHEFRAEYAENFCCHHYTKFIVEFPSWVTVLAITSLAS